jgi:hypothetical protein
MNFSRLDIPFVINIVITKLINIIVAKTLINIVVNMLPEKFVDR